MLAFLQVRILNLREVATKSVLTVEFTCSLGNKTDNDKHSLIKLIGYRNSALLVRAKMLPLLEEIIRQHLLSIYITNSTVMCLLNPLPLRCSQEIYNIIAHHSTKLEIGQIFISNKFVKHL